MHGRHGRKRKVENEVSSWGQGAARCRGLQVSFSPAGPTSGAHGASSVCFSPLFPYHFHFSCNSVNNNPLNITVVPTRHGQRATFSTINKKALCNSKVLPWNNEEKGTKMNSYVICLLKIYSTCYKVSFLRKTLPKQVKACIFLKEYGNMLKSNQKADTKSLQCPNSPSTGNF